MAEKLVATCPVKVFDIEDIGNGNMNFLLCSIVTCLYLLKIRFLFSIYSLA